VEAIEKKCASDSDKDSALHQRWWDLSVQMTDIKRQITEWELVHAPRAGDLATKEERLACLRAELEQLREQFGSAADEEEAKCDDSSIAREHEIGSPERRSEIARNAADARYDRPGGYREKKQKLLRTWASGAYRTRAQCAEREAAGLGVSENTARKWLRGTPEPTRA
jgi:hypothetical protein